MLTFIHLQRCSVKDKQFLLFIVKHSSCVLLISKDVCLCSSTSNQLVPARRAADWITQLVKCKNAALVWSGMVCCSPLVPARHSKQNPLSSYSFDSSKHACTVATVCHSINPTCFYICLECVNSVCMEFDAIICAWLWRLDFFKMNSIVFSIEIAKIFSNFWDFCSILERTFGFLKLYAHRVREFRTNIIKINLDFN